MPVVIPPNAKQLSGNCLSMFQIRLYRKSWIGNVYWSHPVIPPHSCRKQCVFHICKSYLFVLPPCGSLAVSPLHRRPSLCLAYSSPRRPVSSVPRLPPPPVRAALLCYCLSALLPALLAALLFALTMPLSALAARRRPLPTH